MLVNAFSLFLQGCISIKNKKIHLLRDDKEIPKKSKHFFVLLFFYSRSPSFFPMALIIHEIGRGSVISITN